MKIPGLLFVLLFVLGALIIAISENTHGWDSMTAPKWLIIVLLTLGVGTFCWKRVRL